MPIIRQEYRQDFEDIREVIEEAFNQPDEADLVEALRDGEKVIVALVAEEERAVVGHILFSHASIDGSNAKVAGLAPMAVLPEYQNQGIGTLLAQEGLDECLSQGYDAVIVLGHTDYYPRFGFKPASEFGIRSEWQDQIQDDAFMVLELHAGALDGVEGIARYADEFSELI
ncbi:N-acetyltransferase [Pontiellaceae bacterium B12227]|nr:N-acetyltransferase [Pontiellaceae bacterium B12227]